MSDLSRRNVIRGAVAALFVPAAPAIVRVASLMPVSPLPVSPLPVPLIPGWEVVVVTWRYVGLAQMKLEGVTISFDNAVTPQ